MAAPVKIPEGNVDTHFDGGHDLQPGNGFPSSLGRGCIQPFQSVQLGHDLFRLAAHPGFADPNALLSVLVRDPQGRQGLRAAVIRLEKHPLAFCDLNRERNGITGYGICSKKQ